MSFFIIGIIIVFFVGLRIALSDDSKTAEGVDKERWKMSHPGEPYSYTKARDEEQESRAKMPLYYTMGEKGNINKYIEDDKKKAEERLKREVEARRGESDPATQGKTTTEDVPCKETLHGTESREDPQIQRIIYALRNDDTLLNLVDNIISYGHEPTEKAQAEEGPNAEVAPAEELKNEPLENKEDEPESIEVINNITQSKQEEEAKERKKPSLALCIVSSIILGMIGRGVSRGVVRHTIITSSPYSFFFIEKAMAEAGGRTVALFTVLFGSIPWIIYISRMHKVKSLERKEEPEETQH